MAETAEARLKRMRMRSWRRGTKEMDLVLGPFADAELETMVEDDLAVYDRLLDENDQDLMAWLLGQSAPPEGLAPLLARIGAFARARLKR
ncbi:MAG: succinate dehydrogenase assembly factor 2 [Fuscovulum sp.]|nr:succinate dehydrogenase assembly factor 2 [Fuscovulum sp.]